MTQLEELSNQPMETPEEARAALSALRSYAADPEAYPAKDFGSHFHDAVALFQQPSTREAAEVMRAEGLPILYALYDRQLSQPPKDGYDPDGDALLFALKIFAMYGESLERIVAAARKPRDPDGYLWSLVFNEAAAHDSEFGAELIDALADPLPEGFIGVALLDAANTLAREGHLSRHPFATQAGRWRLNGFLKDPDPAHFSYAVSAVAALPFLDEPEALLDAADGHPDAMVRTEAAWARAHIGDERGIARLAELALVPAQAKRARAYLEELERADAIPAAARAPDFEAKAEMCAWLAHPMEFGQPPDHIELFDHRILKWPPTNDDRPVWLFRYRYDKSDRREETDEGIGMVGSVTFALFGEATANLCPEDVYGLHCCWELQQNEDPRAPAERTAAAGRALLGLG